MSDRTALTVAILIALITAVALATPGHASPIRAGLQELELSGTVTGVKSDPATPRIPGTTPPRGRDWTGDLTMRSGHFQSRVVELGTRFSVIWPEGTGAQYAVGAFISPHFPADENASAVPYVGFQWDVALRHGSVTAYYYGPYAGVKLFVNSGAAVLMEPFWQKEDLKGTDAGRSRMGARVGVSLLY
jgi:hypothetical protein